MNRARGTPRSGGSPDNVQRIVVTPHRNAAFGRVQGMTCSASSRCGRLTARVAPSSDSILFILSNNAVRSVETHRAPDRGRPGPTYRIPAGNGPSDHPCVFTMLAFPVSVFPATRSVIV